MEGGTDGRREGGGGGGVNGYYTVNRCTNGGCLWVIVGRGGGYTGGCKRSFVKAGS